MILEKRWIRKRQIKTWLAKWVRNLIPEVKWCVAKKELVIFKEKRVGGRRNCCTTSPTDETPTILQHVVQHVCVFVRVVEFDTMMTNEDRVLRGVRRKDAWYKKFKGEREHHRRNLVCDGCDLSPPLLKVVVTVTTTFNKWNLHIFIQKYQFFLILWILGKRIVFFLLPEAFCGLKHAENAIGAGAPLRTPLGKLTTLPQNLSRLGRGHPSRWGGDTPPHTRPHSAPLLRWCSRLRRLDRRAPDTKSWRRHWSPPLFKVKLRLWRTFRIQTFTYFKPVSEKVIKYYRLNQYI